VEATKHAFELSDDFFRPINQVQLFSRNVRHFTGLPYRGIVSGGSLETKQSACNTSVMSPTKYLTSFVARTLGRLARKNDTRVPPSQTEAQRGCCALAGNRLGLATTVCYGNRRGLLCDLMMSIFLLLAFYTWFASAGDRLPEPEAQVVR
jgi:hypothetical protein